jgi:hypothetical protein
MARLVLIAAAAAAALIFAAAPGCNAGNPRPCTVTCAADLKCPDGTSCGADLYCYGPDETPGSCAQGDDGGDDATDNADVGDDNDGTDGTDDGTDGPDGGDDAACDPCDPVAQCGCSDDQGCYIARDETTPACATAGKRGEEGPCVDELDCAAGFGCSAEGLLGRHCQRYCADDADCGGGLRLCNRPAGTATEIRLCTSDCEPLDTLACGAGEKCTLDEGEDARWDARCLEHRDGAMFEDCFDQFDCGPGLICVDFTTFSSCEALCRVGGTDCGGVACLGFVGGLQFGGDEYGSCDF